MAVSQREFSKSVTGPSPATPALARQFSKSASTSHLCSDETSRCDLAHQSFLAKALRHSFRSSVQGTSTYSFDAQPSPLTSPGLSPTAAQLRVSSNIADELLEDNDCPLKHSRLTGSSWPETCSITLASLLGIGVLGLPYSFSTLGWILGFVCLALFGAGGIFSGLLLQRLFLTVGEARVYPDLGAAAYGSVGRNAVIAIGYTYLAGCVVSMHLTAAISLKEIFAGVGVELCQLVCSGAVAAGILVVMQIQSLQELTWTAIVGVISIIVPVGLLVVRLLNDGLQYDSCSPTVNACGKPEQFSEGVSFVTQVSGAMGIVFAFAGQVIFVELMAEMKHPEHFDRVLFTSTTAMEAVYSLVAIVGYMVYGKRLLDHGSPITSELPQDWAKTVVNSFLFVHVIMAYAISGNVMNTAIFSRICPPAFSEDSGSSSRRLPWFAVTLFTVALCFVVSNLIPFLTDLMGFIGASCGMFTTYIFPCVFSLKLLRHELSPAGVLAIKLVTVLAFIVSGVGVYGTVADIVQNVRHESMGVFTC